MWNRTFALSWLTAAMAAVAASAASAQTCVTDSTVATFATGAGCYAGAGGDGELLLPPTIGAELDGPALPAGWGTRDWPFDGSSVNGTVSFSGGGVVLDGIGTWDPTDLGQGRSVEFVATFGAAPFQHVGFNVFTPAENSIFNEPPWIMFSTGNQASVLRARIHNGSSGVDIDISCGVDPCLGVSHRYRIDWTPTAITFFVDGVSVYTNSTLVPLSTALRTGASDLNGGDGTSLRVDWLRVTPYASPCAHESRLIDSGAPQTDWTTLAATLDLPGGTTYTVETRTGPSTPVSGSWSSYQPVSGGLIASPRGRYLQYRVTLASSGADQTPVLEELETCFALCTPTPEVCDGADNDCDDLVDEGDPGGGLSCSTGQPGVCAAGTTQCSGGAIVCNQNALPSGEVCNGLDDDCDGSADEGNPGGGLGCSTGLQGVCAAGTTQCSGGAVQCTQNTPSSAEACDGLDNDCDGSADEGDPGGGGGCSTGNPGICAAGVEHCQGGVIVCQQTNPPAPSETCNGLDDNCNGSSDEGNPGGGVGCSTGQPGVCAAGTTQCSGGSLQCAQNTASSPEVCDGLDNDCDGSSDEGDPGGGGACATGNPGICAAGVEHCVSGSVQCVQTNTPVAETCNGLDDDCDGSTDEGDPGGGAACTTGNPGICAAGVEHCVSGSVQCVQTNTPTAETCNTLDDDCDGAADEGNPGGGAVCSTGQPGICGPGTLQCLNGSVTCQANLTSVPEVCNGLDDNCSGSVDEGNPGGGVACATGQPGVCAVGTTQCQSPSVVCLPDTPASVELCASGLDENCDGTPDEEPCVLCPPGNTVASSTQTRITLVKNAAASGGDKIVAKGTFVLPAAGLIDPAAQPVTVRITDNAGGYYTGTIPAGSYVASASGRSFKFADDPPYAFDGIQSSRLKISGGDLVTTKYLVKARGLDLPTFTAGGGTITVRVGTRCFQDNADTCTVSSSGAKAKCQ